MQTFSARNQINYVGGVACKFSCYLETASIMRAVKSPAFGDVVASSAFWVGTASAAGFISLRSVCRLSVHEAAIRKDFS